MSAPAAFPDFAGLRRCWHPVCYSSKLDGDPLPVDLLGEPVVVYRGSSGAAHALTDVCAHRGTALSLGHVVNGELRCPYHGWQYGSDGVCTWIPQRADASKVPGKARVASFQCQERYGIVWVTLEEPRWPLPDVPELEDPEWVRVETGPYSWLPTPPASSRTSPTSDTSRGCTRGCSATPSARSSPTTPSRRTAMCCATRSSGRRRRTPTTFRSSPTPSSRRRSGAAATCSSCRTRSCCGWDGAETRAWSTSSPPSPSPAIAAPGT